MHRLSQQTRLLVGAFYVLLFVGCSWVASGQAPYLFDPELWLANTFLTLIVAMSLLQPFFTSPSDALSNAMVGLVALWPAGSQLPENVLGGWLTGVRVYLLVVAVLALLAMVLRPNRESQPAMLSRHRSAVLMRLARVLGSPRIVFSLVFGIAAINYVGNTRLLFTLLAVWLLVVIEFGERIAEAVLELRGDDASAPPRAIAEIERWHDPGLVVARLLPEAAVSVGEEVLIHAEGCPSGVGIVQDRVPVADGALIEVRLQGEPCETAGVGLAGGLLYELHADLAKSIESSREADGEARGEIVGLVADGTEIGSLNIDLLRDPALVELGDVISTRVRDENVLYQIVGATVAEELSADRSRRGIVRANARKIGIWDAEESEFKPVRWVPMMNDTVTRAVEVASTTAADRVGLIPGTGYGISLDMGELVTHNAAILGILGVGKTFLALELIERMIRERTKVLVLDMTGEYEHRLSHHVWDHDSIHRPETAIAGLEDGRHENIEKTGNWEAFQSSIKAEIEQFLQGDDYLRIWSPSSFGVTQQHPKLFKSVPVGATPPQVTAHVTEAAFEALGGAMAESPRLCIVYEEAHSLIPEWTSISFEGDKAAANRTARVIMQGRKYGLGSLVVTQRTANVIKSVLNQCNTIFAMRCYDATSEEFLKNYLGEAHAHALSELPDRHAVVFGKASSSKEPVIVELNDREVFLTAMGIDPEAANNRPEAKPQPSLEVDPTAEANEDNWCMDEEEDPFGDQST